MTTKYLIAVELVTPALRKRHPELAADTRWAIVTHLGDQETIITQSREMINGTPVAPSGRPLDAVCAHFAHAFGAELVRGVTRW